jgi:hypothetical protein
MSVHRTVRSTNPNVKRADFIVEVMHKPKHPDVTYQVKRDLESYMNASKYIQEISAI